MVVAVVVGVMVLIVEVVVVAVVEGYCYSMELLVEEEVVMHCSWSWDGLVVVVPFVVVPLVVVVVDWQIDSAMVLGSC